MTEGRTAFVPNPVFGSLLGLCPLIAAANSLSDGIVLGLGVAISILLLAAILPGLRSLIPEAQGRAASLAISVAIALLYSLAVEVYSPTIAAHLQLYLPLIAVNCVCLHAIRQNEVTGIRLGGSSSDMNRFGIVARDAAGYLAAATIIGAIREIIGMGSLSLPIAGIAGHQWVFSKAPPLRLLTSPAGGFILIGAIAALYRFVQRGRGRRIL